MRWTESTALLTHLYARTAQRDARCHHSARKGADIGSVAGVSDARFATTVVQGVIGRAHNLQKERRGASMQRFSTWDAPFQEQKIAASSAARLNLQPPILIDSTQIELGGLDHDGLSSTK